MHFAGIPLAPFPGHEDLQSVFALAESPARGRRDRDRRRDAAVVSSICPREDPGFVGDITKRLFLDPTTYAPAVIFFPSQYLDWASSQPFFRNGYMERNYDFTVSGRANDVPVSFGAGNRKIVRNTLVNFSTSVLHNAAENIFERELIERYPERRKLIRTLGWIERVAVSGYLAYYTSAPHYRQWRENERLARQLGYK
jgi:hypothetical protein